MASYGFGTQGGFSSISPSYHKDVVRQVISLGITTPQKFHRVCGPHRIFMTWGIFTWSFALVGGTNRVSPDVLPMFPRSPNDVYNATINFKINDQDAPPYGCTIFTVLPIPQNTTLINVFRVTENLTGNNFSFLVAYCPFTGIDSTITYSGVPQTPNTIDMKIVSYRVASDNHRAIGYTISFGAPDLVVRNFPTKFTSVAGVNPLDANIPLNFARISGQQTIVFQNINTGFYFSFDVDYGIIGQAHGYLGWVNPTANATLASMDITNATLVSITHAGDPNAVIQIMQFTFDANDGRRYVFTFNPVGYTQTPPTIELVSPGMLGAEDAMVNVFTRYFYSI
jgi:hypothetical protein